MQNKRGIESIKQISWYDDRWYQIAVNGQVRYVPSVTTVDEIIHKPFLTAWKSELGKITSDIMVAIAQREGVNVHAALEKIAKGETLEYETSGLNQKEWLKTYRGVRWLETIKPQILSVEETVVNLNKGYAGTLDLLIRINAGRYEVNGTRPLILEEGVYLADYKTGSSVSQSAYRQMAAYFYALKEAGVEDLNGALIIHMSSKNKGGIQGLGTIYLSKEKLEEQFEVFCLSLDLWKRINPNASPDIFDMPKQLNWSQK